MKVNQWFIFLGLTRLSEPLVNTYICKIPMPTFDEGWKSEA